ncbi:MAG: hypothetical protein ACM3RX_03255, partial [Methanococcaceae archaeon]
MKKHELIVHNNNPRGGIFAGEIKVYAFTNMEASFRIIIGSFRNALLYRGTPFRKQRNNAGGMELFINNTPKLRNGVPRY